MFIKRQERGPLFKGKKGWNPTHGRKKKPPLYFIIIILLFFFVRFLRSPVQCEKGKRELQVARRRRLAVASTFTDRGFATCSIINMQQYIFESLVAFVTVSLASHQASVFIRLHTEDQSRQRETGLSLGFSSNETSVIN